MMKRGLLVFLLAIIISVTPAMAVPFGFSDIPNNDPPLDIFSNFAGDVSEFGSGQVLISVSNNGPIESFIGQIYFDFSPDNLLSGGAFNLANSSDGVSFENGNNLNLPQGNEISFAADIARWADNPAPQNGINIGETAAFLFDGDFSAVIDAMNAGSFRIGLHAQGIPGQPGSDSYVSGPPVNPVPEPATLLLLGSGILGTISVGRKKMKK